MPYRIDISDPPRDALDRLVALGALDIEVVGEGLAAIMPDGSTAAAIAEALGMPNVAVSVAVGRDDESVWLLHPRIVRLGSVVVAPAGSTAAGDLRLADSTAFGTGHHPTTTLCVEALEQIFAMGIPDSILDVGTGSGVLALAALKLGVRRAVGLDIDAGALEIAAENAGLNDMAARLTLVLGGPDVVTGTWPVVVANVLAAPLIEIAPVLVRRIGNRGNLVLSGIPSSLGAEVEKAYQRCGMRLVRSETRGGWAVLVFQASW